MFPFNSFPGRIGIVPRSAFPWEDRKFHSYNKQKDRANLVAYSAYTYSPVRRAIKPCAHVFDISIGVIRGSSAILLVCRVLPYVSFPIVENFYTLAVAHSIQKISLVPVRRQNFECTNLDFSHWSHLVVIYLCSGTCHRW